MLINGNIGSVNQMLLCRLMLILVWTRERKEKQEVIIGYDWHE